MNIEQKNKLLKRISLASIILAIALTILKIGAWYLSSSISLLASLIDSATDILASSINFFSIRYAMREADNNHHYGHGKAESLSAIAQSMFITGSSFFLILNAIGQLQHASPLQNDRIAIIVMLLSISATAILVLFQRHIIKKTNSPSLKADNLNYLNDLLTNTGVLIALLLSSTLHLYIADPIFAIIIGIIMLHNVWRIIKDGIAILMDSALPQEEMQKIQHAIDNVEGHLGAHRLRARKIGQWRLIDMHLAFPNHISLSKAHEINDHVENKIAACFNEPCEIMIHLEPEKDALDDRHKL